jgi:enoyl-CoA hydratase/carnithine racemase
MDKNLRRKKIQEALATPPITSGVKLTIRNKSRDFNVYQIPLDCLIYNPYNGRFKSKFKTYEALYGRKLDAEDATDVQIISEFLWKSNEAKNKLTLEDIYEKGQQTYGIVTRDGQIVDGNRRFMILSKLHEKYPTKFEYFEAIILDEDIDTRELIRLETEVQLGTDEKEGYNAIEKYLRVDELIHDFNFAPEAIAKMMKLKPNDVEKYQQIYSLFKEYLEFIGHPNHYDLLEGIEDPIIQLNTAIQRIEKGTHATNSMRTVYPEEIEQLKLVVFDTIRFKPTNDHKIVRDIIGRPNAKTPDGIFGRKNIWDDFFDTHLDKIHNKISPTEKAFRDEFDTDDVETLVKDVEKSLQNVFSKTMRSNLTKAITAVKIDNEDDKVLVVVETIRDNVRSLFNNYHDLLVAQYSRNRVVVDTLSESIEYLTLLRQEITEL